MPEPVITITITCAGWDVPTLQGVLRELGCPEPPADCSSAIIALLNYAGCASGEVCVVSEDDNPSPRIVLLTGLLSRTVAAQGLDGLSLEFWEGAITAGVFSARDLEMFLKTTAPATLAKVYPNLSSDSPDMMARTGNVVLGWAASRIRQAIATEAMAPCGAEALCTDLSR